MAKSQQYSTFFVAGQCFGVEVHKVQEINHYARLTRVPLAAPMVRGLINMRGQIVLSLDLRRRLDLVGSATGTPINVVVRTEDSLVSILADEVGDVLRVKETAFERAPDTLKENVRELIRGAYKLDDRLLLILDINKLLTSANGDAARAGSPNSSSQSPAREEESA